MGKAEILENLGEGHYRCAYKYGMEAIDAEVARLNVLLDENATAILTLTDQIAATTIDFTEAKASIDVIIREPGPKDKDWKKRLGEALAILNKFAVELKSAEAAKETAKVTREATIAKSLDLSALPREEERELWMANYSAEINPTGADIATIEVAGEARGENWALLWPAKNEAPIAFDRVMHGERTHALGISPSACFSAWAMLPGWQKYKPTFRVGKILEFKDGGFAKVQLQVPLTSSEQSLPIPPSDPMAVDAIFEKQTHERVPFEYMDCDSIAFKVGDEVLLKYKEQDSLQPVIIGFAHDPEPCAAINVFTANKERLRYRARKPGAWVSVRNIITPRFGSCYWTGESGAVSWVGWRARYFQARRPSIFPRIPNPDEDFTSTSLFHRGVDYGPCPGIVLGGCRKKGYLFVVCRVVTQETREVLYSCPLVGKKAWTEISGVDAAKWPVLAPWYFSQSGNAAASAKAIDALTATPGTQLVELSMPADKAALPPFSASFRVSSKVLNTIVYPPLMDGAESGEGSITTEHNFAVDYVGEALTTLDRVVDTRLGNYFAGGFSTKTAEERRIFVVCSALNLELEDFHTVDTRYFPEPPYQSVRLQKTPAQIDHLNITGGMGQVVSVTRRIDGTATTLGLATGTTTIAVSQTMTLASGTKKFSLLPLIQDASYAFSPSGASPTRDFLMLNSLFDAYFSLSPVAYTVVTRTGHLVTSMPLVQQARAMPPLPVSSPLRLRGSGGPIGAG